MKNKTKQTLHHDGHYIYCCIYIQEYYNFTILVYFWKSINTISFIYMMVQSGHNIAVGNTNKDIVIIENTKDCQHYHYHRYAMKALFRIACRISKKAKKCVCRSATSAKLQQQQPDCEHIHSRPSRSSSKRNGTNRNKRNNSGFGYVKFTESSSSTETLSEQKPQIKNQTKNTTTTTTTTTTTVTTAATTQHEKTTYESSKHRTTKDSSNKNIKSDNKQSSTKLMVHIKDKPANSTATTTNITNTLSPTDETIIGTITKTTTTTTTATTKLDGKQQVNEYLKRPRRNAIFVTTEEERAGLKLVLRYYIQAQSIKNYLM